MMNICITACTRINVCVNFFCNHNVRNTYLKIELWSESSLLFQQNVSDLGSTKFSYPDPALQSPGSSPLDRPMKKKPSLKNVAGCVFGILAVGVCKTMQHGPPTSRYQGIQTVSLYHRPPPLLKKQSCHERRFGVCMLYVRRSLLL